MNCKRVLVVADMVHPFIYRDAFPGGMDPLDLVLCAGDLPGYYIEFIATRVSCPVIYVHGNHGEEKVKDYLGNVCPPGGAENAHGRIVQAAGLTIVGWGGAPRYRDGGEGQYSGLEVKMGLGKLYPHLWWKQCRTGRAIDIMLTHAPPPGPHEGKDFAHRGCKEIGEFIRRYNPPLLVHGHVHAYEGKKFEYLTPEGTRVVNAYGYHVLEFNTAKVNDQASATELRPRGEYGLGPSLLEP